MKPNFSYLLNEKIDIDGKKIFCKVTGEIGSANDGQPYVIAITGGPGFGHQSTEAYIKPLITLATKNKKKLPHFIFFDHLGCGESDKASNPNVEYTVDHFTDIAAKLVEAIKNKLNLPKMDLYVEGGSFGSLVAMNFPAQRKAWLDESSDIQLKQVTVRVMPNGTGEADYTLKFLKDNYGDHPNYQKLLAAQKKLLTGGFKNRIDYMQNFVLPIASLYSKDADKSIIYKIIQGLADHFPNAVLNTISFINRLSKKMGLELEDLNMADEVLNGCSLEVLNHFFGHDFDGFSVTETVLKNKSLYQKIPICMIAASKDHVVNYKISEDLNRELGSSSAVIVFDEPHRISDGASKKIYNQLLFDLLVTGHVKKSDVTYPVIINQTVNNAFNAKLQAAHSAESATNTTHKLLEQMPKGENKKPDVQISKEMTAPKMMVSCIPKPAYETSSSFDSKVKITI